MEKITHPRRVRSGYIVHTDSQGTERHYLRVEKLRTASQCGKNKNYTWRMLGALETEGH